MALADAKPKGAAKPSLAAASSDASIIPEFTDDSEQSPGSDSCTTMARISGGRRLPWPWEGASGLLDYDGDGWLRSSSSSREASFPPGRPPSSNADRLFRNKRDGTFEDVSARSGIAAFPGGYGHGVTVGDYDNDGKPDLFLTRWRSYALYRNRGDGTSVPEDDQRARPGRRPRDLADIGRLRRSRR